MKKRIIILSLIVIILISISACFFTAEKIQYQASPTLKTSVAEFSDSIPQQNLK